MLIDPYRFSVSESGLPLLFESPPWSGGDVDLVFEEPPIQPVDAGQSTET